MTRRRRRRATIVLMVGGTIGLLEGVLIFLNCPIPHAVLIGFFVIGFLCAVVGLVHNIRYVRDDVRNKSQLTK